MRSCVVVAALVLFAVNFTGAVRIPAACVEGSAELLNTTTVDGREMTFHRCVSKPDPAVQVRRAFSPLVRRDGSLCGAPCTTYCSSGSGGPNPYDCSSLASQFSGKGTFTIGVGYTVFWTYASCQVTMSNGLCDSQTLDYCYDNNNWAGVVNYVAFNCQGTTGDNGGSCNFYDNSAIPSITVYTS